MIERYLTLLGAVLALTLGFALVERLAPAERGQPVARWLFNLAYAPFALAGALVLGMLAAPAQAWIAETAGGGLAPAFGGPGSGTLAQAGFAAAFLLVLDFCQYWLHRLQHRVPWLWATHRFHHDEPAVNASVQGRVHLTSYALVTLFHLPVLALFGLRAPHAAAMIAASLVWGFVNHANVRVGFGPMTPLLSSPQWHRIHHSRLPEHRDRNFAIFFPVLDMLFGTYRRPARGEYPPTGLDETPSASLREATVGPFLIWAGMLKRPAGRPGPARAAQVRAEQ